MTDLQPELNGRDVVVRYITRAPQRRDVKFQLFKESVELLHKSTADTLEPHPQPAK